MKIIPLIFISFSFLIACQSKVEHRTGTYYYLWAGLYAVPPTLENQISKDEADKKEKQGEAYYIVVFDNASKLTDLERRYESKRFSAFHYYYTNGEITSLDVINSEGIKKHNILK